MNQNRRLVRELEDIGRIRLSENFFLRDFLHSEIAAVYGIINVPDDLDLAVRAGSRLCQDLLEPLQCKFGKVCIRSGYRSRQLNELGHRLRLGCASNQRNFGGHIWDCLDADGRIGATATIVIPWFVRFLERGGDWRAMAWFIHDHLPYSYMCFYPKLGAFNLQWKEEPELKIMSWREPRGILFRPGMKPDRIGGRADYPNFPEWACSASLQTANCTSLAAKANDAALSSTQSNQSSFSAQRRSAPR